MGDPRVSRVDDTLRSLFESLIPPPQSDEDDHSAEEHIDSAVDYAKSVVHAGDSSLPSEINQAQDLIKRKLLRENASPEKAARFSNLYSRLLAIPVLNQKWSILYLLYKLSEDDEPALPALSSPTAKDRLGNNQEILKDRLNATWREHDRKFNGEAPANDHLNRKAATNHERNGQPTPSPVTAGQRPPSIEKINEVQSHDPVALGDRPSESALLRDLPFNLQGLSSSTFEFTSTTSVKLPANLPIPILSILNTLAEPCLLYRTLQVFTNADEGGLISQSLRAAIATELRSYLTLVATLEGEIRRALSIIEDSNEKHAVGKAGVTLRKCVIWTRDATLGLRLMSLMVEQSKAKHGGQIISLIHSFSSSSGDPFVGAFAEKLLTHVTRPFYDMLQHWIYDGELTDPFREFFVTEPDPSSKPEIDPRRVSTSVWEDKYQVDDSLVPSIISADFAKRVFLIGKSLNFIRHSCGDSDWVMQYSKSHTKTLDYGNTSALASSIDTAYQTTMSRLTHLMSTKFNLFVHLNAIKKYLLLSQGDFIALLMESLAPNLDRPSNSQYRHTLTSQLEHAIRHSNAQYDDPEVLRRLDARMLELSSGEIGWDCFTLEYKISPPCDVVITQWASTQYLKVFNLLWRIKRVEFSLNATWRRCMTGSRGVLASVDDMLGRDWKHAHCTMAEMIHFVNQLQYYLLFEVVEASWEQLQTAVRQPNSTLDDLIEAHTKYINNITRKGLLGSARHSSTGHAEDNFLAQIHYIRKCMLFYREAVEGLYSFSVAEFSKQQQFSAKIEQRTAQGKWGITEKDLRPGSRGSDSTVGTPLMKQVGAKGQTNLGDRDESPLVHSTSSLSATNTAGSDQSLIASLRSRMLQLTAEFRSRVNILLYDLAHQPDVDLRFLGVVMNFNEVYKPVNVRRQQARKDREREKEKRDAERVAQREKEREVSAAGGTSTFVSDESKLKDESR